MAKKSVKAYYQEHQKTLLKKLEHIREVIEPQSAGQLFQNISPEATFLKELAEGVTKFPFRYYQKEAIYTLHAIYKQAVDVCASPDDVQNKLLERVDYRHIKPLLENVDKESKLKAPFLGFEMATGSGKTMLMGATVYYLNKLHGVKNFLIVTPPSSSEIYKKTIRNFQKGTKETVWNADVPFKFNLITGDNYKDTKDLFSSESDANIFIFNVEKFGANATQTKKEWEGSVWKDEEGNTVSLLDFLAENELVIISDEAHHAQSRKAKQIISAFKPTAVIEFTATAVEAEKSAAKKNQTIVYKYDIRRFLEDQYGKKVRVLALPGEEKKAKGKANDISDVEKLKLLTFFLVHLVKKKAIRSDVSYRDLKPIGFVKVKNDIPFSEKVETYIKSQLAEESSLLNIILEKAKAEDTETTNLILELFEKDFSSDQSALLKEIGKVAQSSILLHSKSDKLVRKQFDDIQRNDVEVVIFIDMLNEGIDMPNIYSMVVINDTPSEFKTSVKQIVGRGVRLHKLQREYDDVEDNDLLTHTEKLHIVCDKGASFEEVVLQIQQEFGLTDKTFAIERGQEELIENPVKKEKLKGIQIPKIRIDFKRKKDANILEVIKNYEKIISDYLESNSFNRDVDDKSLSFLKYSPESFFIEMDLFSDEFQFHKMGEELDWKWEALSINEKDMKEVYGRVISKLKPIPDVPMTYQIFQDYGHLVNEAGLFYYRLDEVDDQLAKNRFKDSFTYFYIHYVENEYFELDLDSLDSESDTWLLQNEFKTEKIRIRSKDKKNITRKLEDEKQLVELIKSGYYFYGYDNSVYDYDKFDSYPEKLLADYVDLLIEKDIESGVIELVTEPLPASKVAEPRVSYGGTGTFKRPFWVRNERNVFFEYGTHKYYPDFIFFYNRIIYVIEIKGEKFSNVKKNRLLVELNKVPGVGEVESYVGMVVFELQMKKMNDFTKSFEEFRKEAEEYFNQVQTKAELIDEKDVPDSGKYKEFVPAYTERQAFNKFGEKKEPKNIRWLKVGEADYPESVFAMLVKNEDIGSELKNTWVLFNSIVPVAKDLAGKVVIASHKAIKQDTYSPKHIAIREFSIKEEIVDVGMFKETNTQIHLRAVDKDEPPIVVLEDLGAFKVLGVKLD